MISTIESYPNSLVLVSLPSAGSSQATKIGIVVRAFKRHAGAICFTALLTRPPGVAVIAIKARFDDTPSEKESETKQRQIKEQRA